MHLRTVLPAAAFVLLAVSAQATAGTVHAKIEGNQVVVMVDGQLFAGYKFDASQKYPYFWPVNGPASGKSVTTETSQPYPHHYSLFFGCDRVNGGNYWQESSDRGQIISQGPKIVESSGSQVVFTDETLWKQPGKDPIIRDRRQIVITAPSDSLRFIDFTITVEPLVDIRILKTNHSLFAARVVPELAVTAGGTLINAEGQTAEKGTFAVESPWCDYYGSRSGVTEGLAILQHPTNRWYPAKWFTRDYGFFSPTPMNWLEEFTLPKARNLILRYRVVVHTGDTEKANIATIFDAYKRAKAQPPITANINK
ncbi:MAG: PmoA family protein [Sedimentisphaerales bacterium]|nr:PmoA family protein [Sedimentisphaerales bacterium]